MPVNNISVKFYKHIFTSKKLLSYLLWLHSGMFAASFAYFLALISAYGGGDLSIWLVFSSFFFSIALVANMIATMVYLLGQRIPRVTAKIVSGGLFLYVPVVGGLSMVAGMFFMLGHFSWVFTVAPLILFYCCIKVFINSIAKLKPLDDHEFRELFGSKK
ncbi:putative membrane protein [Vibrio vulnificus]|uniref:hypothetical protein n=1 Tax=Vibrio TaxID=662 RepID=UPI000735DD2D|nr:MULTISPECIES: hypothetical protein [Vibrio]EGQ8024470.1 hypothetical protein [Vibrio vulnificus]EGR0072967.1 hypothetical protein [Vibrio vulnificus]MDE1334211.1 hypothetical protein [Vibrio aestuarianus]OQK64754.1 putative membrane protein [Vibrio vulnificus]OQK66852.1 putative membrane protein [Vibrio vulnificus]